jgi:dethiobiotin synthetase
MVEALGADYWKPVQCGIQEGTDRETVKGLVSHQTSEFHLEAYCLDHPFSPHHAARLSGQELDPNMVTLPATSRPLVVEAVGGILVPFRKSLLMLDLLTKWNSHWVIVSKNYLGSINHTLMTAEVLRKRNIPILGIIFNGDENPDSEQFILEYTGLTLLARIHPEPKIDPTTIKKYAELWKDKLQSKVRTM